MRVSAKGSGFAREYHVQFFGKAVQRAWVASSALLPFAGLEAFHEKAKEMKEEIGKAKTKQKLLKVSVLEDLWSCDTYWRRLSTCHSFPDLNMY